MAAMTLNCVNKFEPLSVGGDMHYTEEAVRQLVVSNADGTVYGSRERTDKMLELQILIRSGASSAAIANRRSIGPSNTRHHPARFQIRRYRMRRRRLMMAQVPETSGQAPMPQVFDIIS